MATLNFTLNSGDCVQLKYVQENMESKRSLLLLHGLGTTHDCWVRQLKYFSDQGYRVLAIDLPGFGESKIIRGMFQLPLLSECIVKLMDALDIEKTTLVGHSMGGPIALHCAHQWPERIESCVFISTFSQIRPTSLSSALTLIKRYVWANFQDAEHQAQFIAYRTFPAVHEADLREAFIRQILATDKTIYQQAVNLMAKVNLKKEARQLKVPALVITGLKDRTISAVLQSELFQQIPNAVQMVIKEGRHGMILDHADMINRCIAAFLSSDYLSSNLKNDKIFSSEMMGSLQV